MKRRLVVLVVSIAALLAVCVPSASAAYLYPAHCGWSTDGYFHYSPAYNIYYRYSGHNANMDRRYDEYNSTLTVYLGTALVHC